MLCNDMLNEISMGCVNTTMKLHSIVNHQVTINMEYKLIDEAICKGSAGSLVMKSDDITLLSQ